MKIKLENTHIISFFAIAFLFVLIIILSILIPHKNDDDFYYIDKNDIIWTVNNDIKKQINITKNDFIIDKCYLSDGDDYVYINDNKNITMKYKNKFIDNIGFMETDNVFNILYFKDGVIIYQNQIEKEQYNYEYNTYMYNGGTIKRLSKNDKIDSFVNAYKKNLLNNENLFWCNTTKEYDDVKTNLYKLGVFGEIEYITDYVEKIFVNPVNTNMYYILKDDNLYTYDVKSENSLKLIEEKVKKFILNDDGTYYIVKQIDDMIINKENFLDLKNVKDIYKPTIFDEKYIEGKTINYNLYVDDVFKYNENKKSINKLVRRLKNFLIYDIKIPAYDLYFVKDGIKSYLCEDVNYVEIVDKIQNDVSNNILIKCYRLNENINVDFMDIYNCYYKNIKEIDFSTNTDEETPKNLDLSIYFKDYASYYILTGESAYLLNIDNDRTKDSSINNYSIYGKKTYILADYKNTYVVYDGGLYKIDFSKKVAEKIKLFEGIYNIRLVNNHIVFNKKDSIKEIDNEFYIDKNDNIKRIDTGSQVFFLNDNDVYYTKRKYNNNSFLYLYDIYKYDLEKNIKTQIAEDVKIVEQLKTFNYKNNSNIKIGKKHKVIDDFIDEDIKMKELNKVERLENTEFNYSLLYNFNNENSLILDYIMMNDNTRKKYQNSFFYNDDNDDDEYYDEDLLYDDIFFYIGDEYEHVDIKISENKNILLNLPSEKKLYDYYGEHKYNDAINDLLKDIEKDNIISMIENDFKNQNLVTEINLVKIQSLYSNRDFILFKYVFNIKFDKEILRYDRRFNDEIYFNYAMKYDIENQSVKFYNVNFHK